MCQQMILLSFVGCFDAHTHTHFMIGIRFRVYVTLLQNLNFRYTIIHFIEWCQSVCWIFAEIKKNESVERIVVWCTAVEQMSWLNWQYQLDIIRGYCSNGNQNEKVLGPHFQSTWCVWIYVGWRVQARAYVIHVIYYAISNKYNRKVKKKVFLQENCSRRRIYTSTQTHFPNILRIVWSIGHHVKCSFFIVGHY